MNVDKKNENKKENGIKRASDFCSPRFCISECRFNVSVDLEVFSDDISANLEANDPISRNSSRPASPNNI